MSQSLEVFFDEKKEEDWFDTLVEFYDLLSKVWIISRGVSHVVKRDNDHLNLHFSVDGAVREVREKILSYTISRMTESLDSVSSEDFQELKEKYSELDTDLYEFKREVKRALEKADEMALKNILEKARKLLPYDKSEVVRGRKLVLRHSVKVEDNFLHNTYDFVTSIRALHKLALVVARNVRPSRKFHSSVATYYWNLDFERDRAAAFLRKAEFEGVITAVRPYKNGKLEVWFESEEVAKKVADALLEQ